MALRRFLLLVLLLSACRRGSDVPAGTPTTPVFIISIDTLRSDHLPAYGYTEVETPQIDDFRRDAVLFTRAYSHCPLTLPSHATILTGKHPADTGIRDNVGFQLDENVPTIAAQLKKQGYATGAAVSAFVMRRGTGLSRGFDFYDDDIDMPSNAVIGRIQRGGAETIERAKRWISSAKERPIFFLLHLYEPHTPYEPPEPFKSRYAIPYDGEIAHVDELVGEFLRFLKESDLYDRSLIVILSDHGEGLGDHREEEHGIFLYREVLQVPLLMKLPGARSGGASVVEPVGLRDVFATIARQTALEVDTDAVALQEFLGERKPKAPPVYSETYYPRFHFGWSDLHSLIDGDHHYIDAPRAELYDLSKDPEEKANILAGTRRVYAAMKKAIGPLIKEADAPASIDPEEAQKLAALGYLGSASTVPGEELPDPKDRIGEFEQIRSAFTAFHRRDYRETLAAVDRLLQSNRRILDVWDLRAQALARLGRTAEAIDAAKEGLRLHPQAAHLAVKVANLALEEGRLDEAEDHAELVLESEPEQAHEILARLALRRGDLAQAEKEANAVLQGSGAQRAAALLVLGRVEVERGNYDQALKRFDEALDVARKKHRGGVVSLNFFRGDALARQGRTHEAEAAFREEIRLFPEEPAAYKNLILLLVAEGRLEEATKLIYELLEAAPTPPSYFAIVQTLKAVGDDRGARYWARKGMQRFPNDSRLRKLAAG